MSDKIKTIVGDRPRLVDFDLFLDLHGQIADELRSRGFAGDALDHAIVECLPHRLALILDSSGVRH